MPFIRAGINESDGHVMANTPGDDQPAADGPDAVVSPHDPVVREGFGPAREAPNVEASAAAVREAAAAMEWEGGDQVAREGFGPAREDTVVVREREDPAVVRQLQDAVQEREEDADLRLSLAGLAGLASGRMSLPALLTRVAELAVRAIPGADGAGLTLLQEGNSDTIVATADFVRAVDDIQYGLGEGPCIMAAARGVTVRSGSLGNDRLWPRFGPQVSRLGVHSALSLPLVGSEGVLGAMNIYAFRYEAFDERAAELGELFAVPAAISVQNAQVLAQALLLASQLETALSSRAVIDQAMGVLMARSGYTSVEAFARLRGISQQENRKLAVVAQALVEQASARARALHVDE